MGRPIKKRWFTVKEATNGSLVDLALTTLAGTETIIAQKGTGVYDVASGRVKLVNKAAPDSEGEAVLTIDGNTISKITQYRMYFFDPSIKDIVWRDGDANLLVTTLVPTPVDEGAEPEEVDPPEPEPSPEPEPEPEEVDPPEPEET